MKKFVVALMCAEKDPITCHRTILVGRSLQQEFAIRHIIAPQRVEMHADAEKRLLRQWKFDANDLFASHDELLEDAYQKQATEIAYVDKELAAARHDGQIND